MSFQIRLTEWTNDERGEPNDEPASRPALFRKMLDCKTPLPLPDDARSDLPKCSGGLHDANTCVPYLSKALLDALSFDDKLAPYW